MEPGIITWVLLSLIGFGASVYGSMVGAGGGFVIVPVLLLLFPNEEPSLITGISLTVALVNAISGSIAYARQRRIDYLSALTLGLPTIPGAVAAAYLTRFVPRGTFDGLLGIVLFAMAAFLFARPQPRFGVPTSYEGRVVRFVTDRSGTSYMYSYNRLLAIVSGSIIGFVAVFFGIGGASIVVPTMIQALHFPTHIATATGMLVLLIQNPVALTTHLLSGTFSSGLRRTISLSVGAVIGGQIGARLSQRIQAVWLSRALAAGLAVAGLRLITAALFR